MDRRVENGRVPNQVRKLMRREAARGFDRVESAEEKRLRLRESYCMIFEDELEILSKQHWGCTLKDKMRKFPNDAWEAFKCWTATNGIELESVLNDDKAKLLEGFVNRVSRREMVEGQKRYEHSLYGCLMELIDGF